MDRHRREAWYVLASPVQDGGSQTMSEVKCWQYYDVNDDMLVATFWELRRFIAMCRQLSQKQRLHAHIRRHRDHWLQVCDTLGVPSAGEAIKSSARAAVAAGADAADDEYVRTEWSVRTDALLALLLDWSSVGPLAGRKATRSMLAALLRRVIDTFEVADFNNTATRAATAICCAGEVDGRCCHMREIFPNPETPVLLERLVTTLPRLYVIIDFCPSALRYLRVFVSEAAHVIDMAVPRVGHNNVVSSQTHDPCKGKKRRIDEDITAHVIKQSRADLLSTGKFASTHGIGSPSAGLAWDQAEACRLISAFHGAFADSHCVSIVADCKRLGNPAEDCLAAAALNPKTGRAVWLPIQAKPSDACLLRFCGPGFGSL